MNKKYRQSVVDKKNIHKQKSFVTQ
ncbi:uncharacterized protein METZ01_LOCUS173087 [marine metagenome]|uniref:Uncharacterized protein n=1 Tax=marine metagenome TaxID=408172 RepID=A0A382C4L7_9ZZZZ